MNISIDKIFANKETVLKLQKYVHSYLPYVHKQTLIHVVKNQTSVAMFQNFVQQAKILRNARKLKSYAVMRENFVREITR
jgi:hypothetical protein